MNIQETITISLRAMRANKVRTALTVLGMVIGIAMVIVVYSAGEGMRGLILGQVESFGTDIVQTEIRVPIGRAGAEKETQSATAMATGVQVATMKLADMEKINKIPNVKRSYAMLQAQQQISYGSELRRAFLLGVSPDFINIDKTELAQGRFFTNEEDKSLAQVIVLGSTIKEKLFGAADPIGKFVKIHKSKYQVIGVFNKRGSSGFINLDDWTYVPVRTVQKKILGIDYIFSMVHQIADLSRAEETAEQIRILMRERHQITNPDKDDFRVSTMDEVMKTLGTVLNAITLLLLAIVGISLVVGGVGIMNIMYVVVSERTMEIGLRKAVGARYNDIMKQFLFEAVLITLIGGLIGVIIGVALSLLVSWLANNVLGIDWRFSIPLKGFAVALGFSFFFGIVFGVYPARKAARLNPIEALISE